MLKIFVLALTLALGSPVDAHEWYDPHCCGGHDCHEVADDDVPKRPLTAGTNSCSRAKCSAPRPTLTITSASFLTRTALRLPRGAFTCQRRRACVTDDRTVGIVSGPG
jgi:hypothetical protein